METHKKVIIRNVQIQDSKQIWRIRNHPRIRKAAFTSEPISLEIHQSWFGTYLSASKNIFWVLELVPPKVIGYCRYDFAQDHYKVSIAIDPIYHGLGYGLYFLSETLSSMKRFSLPIMAFVKPDNVASLRLFRKSYFQIYQQKSDVIEFRYNFN